jgi:hypothetical protein
VLYQLSYLGAVPAGRRTKESAGGYRGSIPGCPDDGQTAQADHLYCWSMIFSETGTHPGSSPG